MCTNVVCLIENCVCRIHLHHNNVTFSMIAVKVRVGDNIMHVPNYTYIRTIAAISISKYSS